MGVAGPASASWSIPGKKSGARVAIRSVIIMSVAIQFPGASRQAMAGAATVSDLAGALGIRTEETALVDELKAGSEEAYAWLVQHYHQPVYSLVYRMLNDSADAADTTQEVFLKVFRGMKSFHGQSSLKTWIYRIALHEASNRRRWWRRHKSHEVTLDLPEAAGSEKPSLGQSLADDAASPLDSAMQAETCALVEQELQQVSEPYRTTVILRDIEELSYDEIAEI